MKHTLSPRQVQIMRRLCAGLAAKEISGELRIGFYTVKQHIREARRRLRARTVIQAASIFSRRYSLK